MSPLARLASIVPPPPNPTASEGDFAPIEADLGARLPADYRALVGAYGYGTFVDFLHLWSPFFAPCPMVERARGALDADRTLAATLEGAVPFALFPDRGGALPFADTDNGDVVYWLTRGEPDAWPVVVWSPRAGAKLDVVEGGATAFLAGWLGGALACRAFPSGLDFRGVGADRRPCFDPWRERSHATFAIDGATDAPYAARLAALTNALAPVELRGAYGDAHSSKRQTHWVSNEGAWRFTYDTAYGHAVRVAAPPDELDRARAVVSDALAPFGLTLREST